MLGARHCVSEDAGGEGRAGKVGGCLSSQSPRPKELPGEIRDVPYVPLQVLWKPVEQKQNLSCWLHREVLLSQSPPNLPCFETAVELAQRLS